MSIKKNGYQGFIKNRQIETKLFFIVFYAIGITGLLIPFSFPFFLKLIPFALILSFIAIAVFHSSRFYNKSIFIFLGIYIIGFLVEVIGVNTKIVFGSYRYGHSLGVQLFNTPIIIGINWLFLVYTSSSVLEKIKINALSKIVLASFIMLIYDIVLEQVAPKMDLWYWNRSTVPIQNYVVWFIIALFFSSLIKVFAINTQNKLATIVLICQFMFFLNLFLFLK